MSHLVRELIVSIALHTSKLTVIGIFEDPMTGITKLWTRYSIAFSVETDRSEMTP